MTDQGHPDPNKGSRDQYKRHIDGDIIVRGQIEAHFPPDFAKAEETERKDQRTYRQKNYTVSWLTLSAVIVYAGLTFWQGCSTKKTADATIKLVQISERSSRPFAGLNGFDITHGFRDKEGKMRSGNPSPESTDMMFRANIKNFGPLPAMNFTGAWKVFLSGIRQPGIGDLQQPAILNPTEEVHLEARVTEVHYREIMSRSKVLTLNITITYDGPEGHYEECSINRYEPDVNGFATIGPCRP